jgi:hypothetical protein
MALGRVPLTGTSGVEHSIAKTVSVEMVAPLSQYSSLGSLDHAAAFEHA